MVCNCFSPVFCCIILTLPHHLLCINVLLLKKKAEYFAMGNDHLFGSEKVTFDMANTTTRLLQTAGLLIGPEKVVTLPTWYSSRIPIKIIANDCCIHIYFYSSEYIWTSQI